MKCVTGATGFIAGHLTQKLLADGCSVRGTTRDLGSENVEALRCLPRGSEALHVFEADLLELGSFDEAVSGCDTVFHVASPFLFTVESPQYDLLAPAVSGTLNVLETCMKTPTVRRVVLTSSIGAIVGRADGTLIDEGCWNTHSAVTNNPYYYAKTQAERAAWSFMNSASPHFDLVVINPGQVLGPSLRRSVGTSVANVRDLMTGRIPAVVDLDIPYVDVRDVAEAHIRAAQSASARGRYLAVAGVVTTRQLIEIIKSLGYRDYRFPRLSLDSPAATPIARLAINTQPRGLRQYLRAFVGRRLVVDNSRIRGTLGVEFRSLHETLRDTIEDLIARRHLSPNT